MPMSLRPPRAQGPAAPVDGPIDPNWGLTMDGAGLPVGDEAPEAVRCPPRRLLLLLDAHVRGWRGLWCGSRSGRALLMSDGRAGAQWLLHRLSKPFWKIKNKKMRSAPGQSALLLEPVGGG